MPRYGEKEVCISGVGKSPLYRKPTVYPFDLCIDACLKAIDDAGLEVSDIDGVAVWPVSPKGQGEGSASASTGDIKDVLGLKTNWFVNGDGPAQYASIANAIAAINAGYCNHVLVWRAEGERWVPMHGQAYADGEMPEVPLHWIQWKMPYWAPSAATWIALHADDHMRKFGISREQIAAIPIVQRENAARNPEAIYSDPLTMDEYMNARMISSPFCLYDCDVPIDGSCAMIISRLDAARDLKQKPIVFEAVGTALHDSDTWFQRDDWPNMAMHDAAKMMWERTDFKPKDVDSAHLYDGFTYLTVLWLEALGMVKSEDMGAFLEGGDRIRMNGDIPLNTNGGQLSEGRLHAFGHLYEAVMQLRGTADKRQIKDAKLAVTGSGGGVYGSSLLLRPDD